MTEVKTLKGDTIAVYPDGEPLSIVQLLVRVMHAVGAVRKEERNEHQKFLFRGIDTVVKAVYPALVENGVVVMPTVLKSEYTTVEVGTKRTQMGHARLTVRYTFYGPAGDTLEATVSAEAMDSGDKATAKAMSVAFRTALLQALCLPTDDPDPDSESYSRAPAVSVEEALDRLNKAATGMNTDVESLTGKFRRENGDLSMDDFLLLPPDRIIGFVQQVEAYLNRSK